MNTIKINRLIQKDMWGVCFLFLVFAGLFMYLFSYLWAVEEGPQPELMIIDQKYVSANVNDPNTVHISRDMINTDYATSIAQIALEGVSNYDAGAYKTRIDQSKHFFTDEAFDMLMGIHQQKEVLESIKLADAKVVTEALDEPRVVKESEENASAFWIVAIPVHTKYDTEYKKFYEMKMVFLTVVISENPLNTYGVAISDWREEPYKQ